MHPNDDDLAGFRWWRVAKGSYEVRDGTLKKAGRTLSNELYWPLQNDPTLYRRFADLPLDDDSAYAAFASAHGLLTRHLFSPDDEPVSLWRDQIFSMRTATQLHDLLGSKTLERIAQPRLRKGVFRVLIPFDKSKHWEVGVTGEEEKYIKTPDARAQYVIARIVRTAMAKHPVELRPMWVMSEQRFQMYPMPTSLLAAMWYQAASAMSGDSLPTLRCEVCGTWMQATRRDTSYCSPACRQKAYRTRSQKA